MPRIKDIQAFGPPPAKPLASSTIRDDVTRQPFVVQRSCACLAVGLAILVSFDVAAFAEPDFNRDIRPILSNYCYKCHGFDASARVHDLRLDVSDKATSVLDSGQRAIVPGEPGASELIARVTSSDADQKMPPPTTNRSLSESQIQLLRQWIAAGAEFQPHWSYVPPERPSLPAVRDSAWVKNELDRFVVARLEEAGLTPSRTASRRKLIRRLHFDLTGLPPALADVEAFVHDTNANAYERLVDRLLASPHYGERMAQNWLDAARYADTTGYAADAPRTQWLYRDWVIDAFNNNLPFDQFAIEQLAGDMLPDATTRQRIATGFHRQSVQALGNNPRKEEFRIKGIVDRLMTTGRVWMGITLECAECHDHKFDPVTQKEYYQLFAIFNNVPHRGEAFEVHGPRIDVLPPEIEKRRAELRARIATLELSLNASDVSQRQLQWESNSDRAVAVADHSPIGTWFAGGAIDDPHSKLPARLVDPVAEYNTSSAEAEWSSDSPLTGMPSVQIRSGRHLRVLNSQFANGLREITIAGWIKTTDEIGDIVSKYDWRAGQRAFAFGIGGEAEPSAKAGRLFAWFSSEASEFRGVEIYGSQPVNDGQWHHVAVVMRSGESVRLYIDGEPDRNAEVKGKVPELIADNQRHLAIGAGFNNSQLSGAFAFEGKLASVQLFDKAIDPVDCMRRLPIVVEEALKITAHERTAEQSSRVAAYYQRVDPKLRQARRKIAALAAQDHELDALAIEAQVMEEMQTPRPTHLLIRGSFENKGELVKPGVPAFLPPLPPGAEVNRLTFAQWLVADDHPLTSRVTVNRFWQHFFGSGLVRTDTDFGYQGDWPTHPKLLDWLATEFVASQWDVKALVKRIVMSATYRQDSATSPQRLARDPENRLLARASRFRLPAEQLRDAMLDSSGLLDRRLGGASVFPVQPAGLYGERTTTTMGPFEIGWTNSAPKDRYRRGMYVFWKRTILYPSLRAFDAPTRDVCTTRRSVTNTPMQALVALNDPVFIEGARAFAQRVLRESPTSRFEDRLARAFRLSLGRAPASEEVARFREFHQLRQQHYVQDPAAAMALLGIGAVPCDTSTPAADLAAWTLIASTILNLDEAVTRE